MLDSLATGVAGPLALVLGLVFLAAAAWRRFRGGAVRRSAPPAMEVVQRLALGPKQGLTLVRIHDRLYAVGTGEGVSVTPIGAVSSTMPGAVPVDAADDVVSLDSWAPGTAARPARSRAAAPRTTTALDANGDVRVAPAAPKRRDLQDVLRTALRTATTLGLAIVCVVAANTVANAQAPAAAAKPVPTTGQAPTSAATAAATPAAPAPAGGRAAAATATAAPAPLSAMKTTEQLVQRLAPQLDVRMGGTPGANDGLRMSGTVGVVVMMGLLTLLPAMLLLMTGFARILIVMQFVRQAIGAQSAPPGQLLAALALLLTAFVMGPTLEEANRTALQPWLAGTMEQAEMMETAVKPFRAFMLRQTRDKDIETFLELSATPEPKTPDDIPLVVLASAFTTSELRTAFQMGFAVFLPFIIVDMVVSSVLMSMGMYMLPPAMIALPFKLLLFVLVDGWTLVVQSLVQSFR
jgi:flagellar biosynthesis protein FliP